MKQGHKGAKTALSDAHAKITWYAIIDEGICGKEVNHGIKVDRRQLCPGHTKKMRVVSSRRETERITESTRESKSRADVNELEPERVQSYSNALPSCPVMTNWRQRARHCCILALIFLSLITFSIHSRRTLSSSGTKNEESNDKIVSKVAELDVM